MQWTLSHLPDYNIIHIETQGDITINDLIKMSAEVKNLCMLHKSLKILTDHRTTVSKLKFIDIFNTPNIFDNIDLPRAVKMAHIFPESQYTDFSIFETLSRNKGYQVRIFNKKHLALEWLTNE